MNTWETYSKVHANRKPREQLVSAIGLCDKKHSALDLGAGTLIESRYFLEVGFEHVIAVDSSPQSKEFAEHIVDERFELQNIGFRDFLFESEKYDIVNAQFSLPFYGSKDFTLFIENIISSLKTGGIFVGQFFGNRDEWNESDTKLAFQTKEEILEMLKDLDIIEFEEEEKEGSTASGIMKHWHVFHFRVKKK